MNFFLIKKNIFLIIITISLVVNLTNLKNYGYAWDDGLMRLTGFVNLKYLVKKFYPNIENKFERLKKVPELNKWRDRYYGPSFELFAASIEYLTGNISNNKNQDNKTDIYYLRCTILILLLHITYFFFFKTNIYISKNYILSNISLLLLISFPRFFAEQHYNTKDLYLCGLSIMIFYFGFKILNKLKIKNILLFSFFSALAISTRLSATLMPSFIMFFFILKNGINIKSFKICGIVLFSFLVFFYISFPFLWESSLNNFITVFNKLSNHSWNGYVLYLGNEYKNTETPWHYIPIWFIITTPIIYLIYFLIGLIYSVFIFFKNGIHRIAHTLDKYKFMYINLAIFLSTLFALIFFQNNTYNGWRHSYFLFICFLLFIVSFISSHQSKIFKIFSKYLLFVLIISNIIWIYKNHPYENLYFNTLVKKPYQQFDLDWWGLSNYEQIRFVLDFDKSNQIRIWAASGTSIKATTKNLLTLKEKDRIIVVENKDDADYILNNYINNLKDYSKEYKLINELKVSNSRINSLYKIR